MHTTEQKEALEHARLMADHMPECMCDVCAAANAARYRMPAPTGESPMRMKPGQVFPGESEHVARERWHVASAHTWRMSRLAFNARGGR